MATMDVLLFSGQGLEAHFSDVAAVNRIFEVIGNDKSRFDEFLSACLRAFKDLYESLSSEERSIFNENPISRLSVPTDLLFPHAALRAHPVFEATTLYIRQILDLMLYGKFCRPEVVSETSGVCTGIIPAIIAASCPSYLSEEFLEASVGGFQICFMIGVKASIWCRKALGEEWNQQPWARSIIGMSPKSIENQLETFRITESGSKSFLRISAILDDDVVSVAGPKKSFDSFRSYLSPPPVTYRDLHIHAYYHGGKGMKALVNEVLSEISSRGIPFLDNRPLRVPVRIGLSGDIRIETNQIPPLEAVLKAIFVDSIEWNKLLNTMIRDYTMKVEQQSNSKLRIIGLGPGSKALFTCRRKVISHPRISYVEQLSDESSIIEGDSIAIVGISAHYPSGQGLDDFWSVIESGCSTMTEIPSSRFDLSKYYNTNGLTTGKRKLTSKHGNFLSNPFQFDTGYFSISPREAKSMDPQQRLLLHSAVEALENAGYVPDSTSSFQKKSFGVYIGVATNDYVDNLRDDIDVYYSPGTLRAFLSGRISYAFDFEGPSLVIDTACSSSSVAIHNAVKDLRSGDCTAALAGGVNVISSPDMYLGLSRAHFLSPTGQCKPFDISADGYCRSEGCGLVVLKTLSRAIEEGDHIYGVIRSSGVNQCGTAKSITHPDAETQASLFSQLINSSRLDPDTISVVEAHGTGTQAGDFAEATSLTSVFSGRSTQNPLHICSVKGNIGHAEAASGVAGLTKLLLMMEKAKIPPQGSFKTMNPRISFLSNENIRVSTALQDWKPTRGYPRRALLNNFGAAGSNVALIVEEAPTSRPKPPLLPVRSHHILNISAKSASALESLRREYADFIVRNPGVSIQDICYTANARRRDHQEYRLSVLGTDLSSILKQLQNDQTPAEAVVLKPTKKVFIFSGQGGAYRGMGAALLHTAPEFWAGITACDAILTRSGFSPVFPFISGSSAAEDSIESMEYDTVVQQCACFALEYSLARFWISLGVIPDLVFGHSIGEYAAMVTSKALSLEDALLFIANRARLLTELCQSNSSGMMTCQTSLEDLRSTLQEAEAAGVCGIDIACHNSPNDYVVAGPLTMISELDKIFQSKSIFHKQLNVSYAFHSSAMDQVLSQLASAASTMKFKQASIPLGSSVYGRILTKDYILSPDYVVSQTRQPVLFTSLLKEVEASCSDEVLLALEIGPTPSASRMLKSTFDHVNYDYIPSLRRTEAPWAVISTSLQSLYLQGHAINWREVYRGASASHLNRFPKYPLLKSEFVVPFQEHVPGTIMVKSNRSELNEVKFEFVPGLNGLPISDEMTLHAKVATFSHLIKAHAVGGTPLCPASVYFELALEALMIKHQTKTNSSLFEIDEISFDHPLVMTGGSEDSVQILLKEEVWRNQEIAKRFSITSGSSNQVHSSGLIHETQSTRQSQTLKRHTAYVQRQMISFFSSQGAPPENLSTRTIYEVIFPRVVNYSAPFLTLKHLYISNSGLEGYGTFKLPDAANGRFVCPPMFIDTLFHAAGFIANKGIESSLACICVSCERFVAPSLGSLPIDQEMSIYCSLVDIGDSIIANAFVIGGKSEVIAYAEGMCFKKIRLQSFNIVLSRAKPGRDEHNVDVARGPNADLPSRHTTMQTETTISQSPASQSESITMSTLTRILKDVCGTEATSPNQRLSEMGVDSLLFIELTDQISRQFPNLSVEKHAIESCQLVSDLILILNDASQQSSSPTSGTTSSPSILSDISTVPSEMKPLVDARLEVQLHEILSDLCGASIMDKPAGTRLSHLGIDSLLSVELIQDLQHRLNLDLDIDHSQISEMTIGELESLCVVNRTSQALETVQEPQRDVKSEEYKKDNHATIFRQLTPDSFPVHLQVSDGSTVPSLYLCHDGSGLTNMYSRIRSIDRHVYGIFSLDLEYTDPSIHTMEDLARKYIERGKLDKVHSPILGGWSFGGVLAFEISRQLRKLGNTPKGVILIDSPFPIGHEPLPQQIIQQVLGTFKHSSSSISSEGLYKARLKIQEQFLRHAQLLERYNPAPEEEDVTFVAIKCTRTLDTKKLCGVSYPWLSEQGIRDKSFEAWDKFLTRRGPTLTVDCNHFDPFNTGHIDEMADRLAEACRLLEE